MYMHYICIVQTAASGTHCICNRLRPLLPPNDTSASAGLTLLALSTDLRTLFWLAERPSLARTLLFAADVTALPRGPAQAQAVLQWLEPRVLDDQLLPLGVRSLVWDASGGGLLACTDTTFFRLAADGSDSAQLPFAPEGSQAVDLTYEAAPASFYYSARAPLSGISTVFRYTPGSNSSTELLTAPSADVTLRFQLQAANASSGGTQLLATDGSFVYRCALSLDCTRVQVLSAAPPPSPSVPAMPPLQQLLAPAGAAYFALCDASLVASVTVSIT